MNRPPAPDDATTGYHYAAVVDTDALGPKRWLAVTDPVDAAHTCRMLGTGHRACGKTPTVAKLDRGRVSRVGGSVGHRTSSWWYYCAEHLFGRWVEDGQVVHWRLVPNEEAEG